MENNSNKSRKLWKIINSKVNRRDRTGNNVNSIFDDQNGRITMNKYEMSNKMNYYFCDIGKKLGK